MSLEAGYFSRPRALTDIFGASVSGASPAPSTAANVGAALNSIVSDVQTRSAVKLDSVVSYAAGAGANIQTNMQSAASVEMNVEADMMAFRQTIKAAQSEILAAAKATGNGGMFGNTPTGDIGEGGLLLDAVMGGVTDFQGAGSFALKAVNSGSMLDTVANEIGDQRMSREEAESAIQDRLVQMASARNAEMAMQTTNFFDGPQPEAPGNAAFDWPQYFKDGGTAEALINVNADDPDTFAQYRDLTEIYGDVETTTAELARAQTETLGHNRDNVLEGTNEQSIAVKSWNESDKLLLGIHSAREILEGISGARVPDGAVNQLEARSLIEEIAPTTIRPSAPSFPVAGMNA